MALRFKDFPTIGESRTEPVASEPPRPRIRPNAFAVIARASVRHRLAVAMGLLAFAFACAIIGLGHFEADPAQPPRIVLDPGYAKARDEIAMAFPGLDDTVAFAVSAEDPQVARSTTIALVRELRARPELFDRVFAPGLGKFYEENAILYVSKEEARHLAEGLERRAPLFRAAAAFPNLAGFAALASQVEASLAAGSSPEGLEGFFTAAARTVAGEVEGRPRPLDWNGLVELTPRIEETQWVVQATILKPAALDAARELATAAAAGGASIKVNGPATEREARVQRLAYGARLAGVLGLVLASVILATGLGSLRIGIVVFANLLALAGLALALPIFDGRGSDSVSIFYIPLTLLIGAELFTAHALRAWEEEEEGGYGRRTSVVLSAHRLGLSSLLIAVAATASLAWLASGYLSMRDLALRLTIGVAAALGLALTLLPALLSYGGPYDENEEKSGKHWLDALLDSTGNLFWRKFRAAAAAACIVIAAAGLLVLPSLELEPDRLDDASAQLLAMPKDAPALVEKLAKLREVGSIRMIESFLPARQKDNIAELAKLHGVYPERAVEIGLRGEEEMRADFDRLQASLQAIGGAPNASSGLSAAANELRRNLALFDAPLPAGADQLRRLEVSLFGGLDALLARVDKLARLVPMTAETIDPQLAERFVAKDRRWRIEIRGASGVAANRFANAVREVAPLATGPALTAVAETQTLLPSRTVLMLAILPLLAVFLVFRRGRGLLAATATFATTAFFFTGLIVLSGATLAASQVPVFLLFLVLAAAIACRPTLRAETSRFGAGTARRAALLIAVTALMAGLPMLLAPATAIHQTGEVAGFAAASLIVAAVVLQPQIAYWLGLETWRFRRGTSDRARAVRARTPP
jgi:hypothetical protein